MPSFPYLRPFCCGKDARVAAKATLKIAKSTPDRFKAASNNVKGTRMHCQLKFQECQTNFQEYKINLPQLQVSSNGSQVDFQTANATREFLKAPVYSRQRPVGSHHLSSQQYHARPHLFVVGAKPPHKNPRRQPSHPPRKRMQCSTRSSANSITANESPRNAKQHPRGQINRQVYQNPFN